MSDTLKSNLRELAMIQRELGHKEFRIAAMRMFESLGMHAQGVAVGLMVVEDFLTTDELAERERTP
jgi:hypothetical protein